jgi:hypothetical protein
MPLSLRFRAISRSLSRHPFFSPSFNPSSRAPSLYGSVRTDRRRAPSPGRS